MRRVAIAYVVAAKGACVVIRGSAWRTRRIAAVSAFRRRPAWVMPAFPNDRRNSSHRAGPCLGRPDQPTLTVFELPGGTAAVSARISTFKYKAITLSLRRGARRRAARLLEGRPARVGRRAPLRVLRRCRSISGRDMDGVMRAAASADRSGRFFRRGPAENERDTESLPTTNYGGAARDGSRKKHLAFSLGHPDPMKSSPALQAARGRLSLSPSAPTSR